ncbi:MAG: hypothetical protein J6C30_07760, partial [Lentisphaeria bacterium]|nr:hypothetical protein [Lentisphaeria bacterium]
IFIRTVAADTGKQFCNSPFFVPLQRTAAQPSPSSRRHGGQSTLKACGITACGLARRIPALHTILRSEGARESSAAEKNPSPPLFFSVFYDIFLCTTMNFNHKNEVKKQ